MYGDQHYRELELHQALTSMAECAGQDLLFAILDGTGSEPVLQHFFRYAPEAEYYPLFLGTELADCVPNSPYLVQIPLTATDFVQQVSDTRCSVIWFSSRWTLEQLVPFWQCRLYGELPDQSATLLRCWNGTILEQLLLPLSAEAQQRFLPPVAELLTPDQKLRQWQRRPIHSPPDLHYSRWQITPAQLAVFNIPLQLLQVRDLETQLWTSAPELLEQIHPALISSVIAEGLQTAGQLGLLEDESVADFVRCSLHWGKDFWRHPQLEALWRNDQSDSKFLAWLAQVETGKGYGETGVV